MLDLFGSTNISKYCQWIYDIIMTIINKAEMSEISESLLNPFIEMFP